MISNNVKEIDDLIRLIAKLPGLGPKSAKRIVLKLIDNRDELVKPLVNTLAQVYKNVIRCNICGNIKSVNSNCSCSNKNCEVIIVVESLADAMVVESSGACKGAYFQFHILGGTLPSFENKKYKNGLLIDSLVNRVKKNPVKEVILGLSATVEGETTGWFIVDSLKNTKVKITRLAKGLPVGGEIEFLDDGTLSSAFKNRFSVAKD